MCGIGSPPEEYGDTDTQIRIRALGECGWNFELNHADSLVGKHILIVDDVLRTGVTTVACASRLAEVEGVRLVC